MNEQALETKLRAASDQCVRCGLCLPHCPTYRERRDEGESPRGRIALIQGWAEGRIEGSARLHAHLASCLECRACETACPSLVAFGALMDDARALGNLRSRSPARLFKRTWLDAMSSGRGTRTAALLARLYRACRLDRVAEWSGVTRSPRLASIHRLALQLERPPRLRADPPDRPGDGQEIDLFLGCVGQAAQPAALVAAHRVLQRLGFRVMVPTSQGCCGAMHRHNGFPVPADRLLARNATAFAGRPSVGIASACVAELRSHPGLGGTLEVCRFLADRAWTPDIGLRPLYRRIAVHEPCSQRNLLRDGTAAYDLLRRIPGIELVPLADNAFCCGAAGTYLLQQPAMSQALLRPKIRALAELGAGILVTTNTGCALHLAAGAREAGLPVEVLHPVELIERQLADRFPGDLKRRPPARRIRGTTDSEGLSQRGDPP